MELETGAKILEFYRNQEQNLSTFKTLEELIDEELEKAKSFPVDKPVGVPSRNYVCEPFELMKTGGVWLGAVRTYIQHNFIDGDRLNWSSEEELRPHITMKQLQEIAAYVAASVYKEVSKP